MTIKARTTIICYIASWFRQVSHLPYKLTMMYCLAEPDSRLRRLETWVRDIGLVRGLGLARWGLGFYGLAFNGWLLVGNDFLRTNGARPVVGGYHRFRAIKIQLL